MTTSYELRLACLALAVLCVACGALALAVRLMLPALLRWCRQRPGREAAPVLWTVRMMPAAGALALTFGVCLPAFVRWEPIRGDEPVGRTALVLALCGAALWLAPPARLALALWRERRIKAAPPPVALVGVLRPRVRVSGRARRVLDAEQLEAAVRHEQAHLSSHDNLKRLLIWLTPGGWAELDRAWAQAAEWAADERAAAGCPRRASALAGALLQVARLGPDCPPRVLGTPLLRSTLELKGRIDRLLRPEPGPPSGHLRLVWLLSGAALVVFATGLMQPAGVHRILEELIR